MPKLAIAVCSAAVPELVAMQCATPRYSAQSRSRPATAGASAPHSMPPVEHRQDLGAVRVGDVGPRRVIGRVDAG